MVPMIMLTTSFILLPAPTGPSRKLALPMASRPGRAWAWTASSPPQRKMSVPVSAGTLEPETGASRNTPPRATMRSLMLCMRSGDRVAQSTMLLPGVTAAISPPASSGQSNTASDASIVDSMLNVREHCCTTAAADSATVTLPGKAAASSVQASGDLFHTTRLQPSIFLSRLAAMPLPMMPSPTNPSGEPDISLELEPIFRLTLTLTTTDEKTRKARQASCIQSLQLALSVA